ncbi:MAG: VacB/RNase II family 3'-5' exoribonuclease, partial [Agathobacter sp.]|nr:VacB/RNase II family 3'-5' exoribonuclease [Agathobacter sp.]
MNPDLFKKRKQNVYNLICDEMYVPMKIKELAIVLNVKKEERPELEQILAELLAEGKISLSKRGKYIKSEEKQVVGTFTAHAKRFGFVTIEGEEEDIFIPESKVGDALHMDTVQVVVSPLATGRRKEGVIVKVLERGMKQIVCTYEQSKNFGFAVPDNPRFGQDIFIPLEKSKGAVKGHKVVVEITKYAKPGKSPEGKVVEILGHINDPGTDILSIVRAYDLPMEFSEKIMHQVENVAKEVLTADMAGRMDLRDVVMVTIDGEDAKDLDDAVSLSMDGDNYMLGVHIADVTNYVQEKSALDVEALKRGTSVYLVDRVIPMLPHALSNGICSLNAGENRLALSCIMTINPKGEVIDHKIAETVIKVNTRMSYTSVKKILEDKDETEIEKYRELVPMFEQMRDLAAILRKKRMSRGSIDFDFPETKVILDAQGKPVEIKPYDRNVATKIIEDFMLIAN